MINKIPELKRLELNKQNVMKVLFECKANQQSHKTITSSFYAQTSKRQAPPIQFDLQKLYGNAYLIRYLIGQLKGIHEQKDELSPAEGIIDYKGKKWTDDNRALFALYYLGTACSKFPRFIDGEKSAITKNLPLYYEAGLKPTYAPSDSNFKLEDARNALDDLGVKLPENITLLD